MSNGRSKKPRSPFTPGLGKTPPVLAGREYEQRRLDNLCGNLIDENRGAHRPAVLIGPRGNGKTVLLDWLKTHAERGGVDTIWVTPTDIPTVAALAERIEAKPPERSMDQVDVGGSVAGFGLSTKFHWSQGTSHSPPDLVAGISARCQGGAFALFIDESHNLDNDVGTALLNAAQTAARNVPFLLALAGTPDLESKLDAMDATFWNRCLAIGVERLELSHARSAIERPLRAFGVGLESHDLWNLVLAESQGYPFYVQILGEALWDVAFQSGLCAPQTSGDQGRLRTLDAKQVQDALEEASKEKTLYYSHRRNELDEHGLLPCAESVAKCFEGKEVVPADIVKSVVSQSVGRENRDEAYNRLRHVGYIWTAPRQATDCQAGIPSLMDFVTKERIRIQAYQAAEAADTSAKDGDGVQPP